jgi:hypothetical protein
MTTQTPKEMIYIIVIAEAVLALIGVSALSLSLFYKTYADPAILTALIAITSGLVGALGSILSNTRQAPLGSFSETTAAQVSSGRNPPAAPELIAEEELPPAPPPPPKPTTP